MPQPRESQSQHLRVACAERFLIGVQSSGISLRGAQQNITGGKVTAPSLSVAAVRHNEAGACAITVDENDPPLPRGRRLIPEKFVTPQRNAVLPFAVPPRPPPAPA